MTGHRVNADEVDYICRLMHDNFHIPIRFRDGSGELVAEYPSGQPARPAEKDEPDDLAPPELPYSVPVLSAVNKLENRLLFRLGAADHPLGAVIMGPTVKNKTALLHAGGLLYYLLHGNKLDISDVYQAAQSVERTAVPAQDVDLDLSDRRENFVFHHDPILEKRLLQYVKEGRKEELASGFDLIPRERAGVLSKRSRLRNEKNLAICLITLVTRAAIEGGLFPETAFTVSDLYIQHIEELQEVEEVSRVSNEALLDFAERVRGQRNRRYSKAVAACQNYIFNHLYKEITLTQLAAAAGLAPGYLSQLFKRETGLTVSEYIQRVKVEEAGKLLLFTDDTLLAIGSRLNFHDQSHFIKVFKKHTGLTPRQFRNRQRE
ncbi:helix-turn-helix domain-containing protein [Cohnella sp.]|uniref:helix-turn-helix domain-containing protein n=1 Tax=Cohnella sp. TaxID=1883426 RepID=UPI00356B4857